MSEHANLFFKLVSLPFRLLLLIDLGTAIVIYFGTLK